MIIRHAIALLSLFLLTGCGYRFEGSEAEAGPVTITVPYIKGDLEGVLNNEIVRALSTSGQFECVQSGGALTLEAAILSEGDDRVGYRYDRDPTNGKRRTNIIGTENRLNVTAEVKLIDAHSGELLMGPQQVKAFTVYDYYDNNSIKDLTFIGPNGQPQKVLDFSLGQLDSVEGAHDDSFTPLFRMLAQKIVDGVIVKANCDAYAKKAQSDSEKEVGENLPGE
ncbi:MAG: hypothetical protein HYX67_05160 [Candidatus Melainabacteria bacterium]|nr:hypothetical protein [Candidatus Melainabacteria bacterium]